MKFFVIAANISKTKPALPCQEPTSSIALTMSPHLARSNWRIAMANNGTVSRTFIEYNPATGFGKISPEELNEEAYRELFETPKPKTENDNVNHPSHYTQGSIECIDAIEASMEPAEFRGAMKANIIKYLWRYKHKNGLEDLKKARFYLERMIASYEKDIGKEQT